LLLGACGLQLFSFFNFLAKLAQSIQNFNSADANLTPDPAYPKGISLFGY
jgi:hypothetical protein